MRCVRWRVFGLPRGKTSGRRGLVVGSGTFSRATAGAPLLPVAAAGCERWAGSPGGRKRAGEEEVAQRMRKGGGVMNSPRYAGGVRRPWWLVVCAYLPAFRLVGKLESWRDRAEGARQGLGGGEIRRRARAGVGGDGKGWSQARKRGSAVGGLAALRLVLPCCRQLVGG